MTVANTLVKTYESNSKITISGNYRLGEMRDNYADLTKIREKLGLQPKVSFEEGINRFTKWAEVQEVVEDKYEKSIEEIKDKGVYK